MHRGEELSSFMRVSKNIPADRECKPGGLLNHEFDAQQLKEWN